MTLTYWEIAFWFLGVSLLVGVIIIAATSGSVEK